jgi:hypothetical protein
LRASFHQNADLTLVRLPAAFENFPLPIHHLHDLRILLEFGEIVLKIDLRQSVSLSHEVGFQSFREPAAIQQ